MTKAVLLCFALSATGQSSPDPDLSAILESLYDPIDDVQFEFEGRRLLGDPGTGEGSNAPSAKILETFSGSLSYRKDGAVKQVSFHHQDAPRLKSGTAILHRELATLRGKATRYEEQAGLGGAETTPESFVMWFDWGSPGRVFLPPYLKGLARYPKKRIVHEGTANVGEYPCQVFSVVLGANYEDGITDKSWFQRFYLDINRGGHPIQFEERRGKGLVARIVDVALELFDAGDGRKIWLPVSSRYEAMMGPGKAEGDPFVYRDTPWETEVIHVMKGSVRVNQHLSDKTFVLRFKDGTVIKDGIHRKSRRVGDAPPPASLAQAEEQLKNLVAQAEMQGDEVKATSLTRGGRGGLAAWLPWMVSIASLTVLGLIVVRRRLGQ